LESNCKENFVPLDREGLEALLVALAHDAAKPHATVTMFLNILDDVLQRPEDRRAWIRNVEKSFAKMERRLEELRTFTLRELEAISDVAIDLLLDEVNSELKVPLYSFTGTPKGVRGDPRLLKLFLNALLDWVGADSAGWKESGRSVEVTASEEGAPVFDFFFAAPLPEASPSLPVRYLSRALCEWIAKLHGGRVSVVKMNPAHLRLDLSSRPGS
jgi:hypothetical protein